MKSFAMSTLGCKVNTYESEALKKLLESDGYIYTDFKNKADVYIINTCTVTNKGDSKSRQKIRQAIKQNKDAIVCVVGCYAQVSSQEVSSIEGVDIVMGTQNRDRLLEHINQFMIDRKQKVDVDNIMLQKTFEGLEVETFKENTRAFLKIQEGCNNYCTFCIIPFARGRLRSRPANDVIREANVLVQHGFKEIVLTGIHTAGYGEDLENFNFDDLVYRLCTEVEGLNRLRISSIEASQISDRLIGYIKDFDVIAKHMHIPIQAGSDHILDLMRRKYTIEAFKNKIRYLKNEVPQIAISTDVIVGFPGESELDFEETYKNILDIEFSSLHVFPYSKRKNTPAARMDNQIDEQEKQKRVKSLIQLSKKLEEDYAKLFIGHEVDVIFEEYDDSEAMWMGHSSEFLKVKVESSQPIRNHLLKVRIKEVRNGVCFGEIKD